MTGIYKVATVRVPVQIELTKAQPGEPWVARLAGGHDSTPFCGNAPTEAQAKAGMAAVMANALHRYGQLPVMVLGGAEDYTNHVHLIVPDPAGGYLALVVNNGRYAALWTITEETIGGALKRILDHVGGSPQVVKF